MITNKDLLKEISVDELIGLSDIHGDGELNQDVIDSSLNDAISFIESFIILPSNPTPLVKKIVIDLSIYELKRKNELLRDADKELKKENESYLLRMSTGKLKTEMLHENDTATSTQGSSFAFRHKKKKLNMRGFNS